MERNKKDIRKEILGIRRGLSDEEVINKSELITKKILNLSFLDKYNDVLIYSDYNHEVMTDKLIILLMMKGKNVYLPKVDGKTMDFYRIFSLDDLEPGAYGIREPMPIQHMKFEYNNNGIIIMPLAACDKNGNRIGYGGGFYDRYLESKDNLIKIGLAFKCQIVDKINAEETDIKLNYIVSEDDIYEV